MHCTQCGAEANGKFCASCGASLQTIACVECGVAISPGTRFCTRCGAPARAPSSRSGGAHNATPAGSGGNLGWWVAGGLLSVILIGLAIWNFGRGGDEGGGGSVAAAPELGPTGAVDLSSMSPREAAERLYTRVMMAVEEGNDAEARSFLPMAIDAYGLAAPLDEDGMYHLALLQGAAEQHTASLETSLEGMQEAPEHLLLLSTAAEAAKELGDDEAARGYYSLMLDAWDREMALLRPEYTDHARMLPLLREDAEVFLSGEAG